MLTPEKEKEIREYLKTRGVKFLFDDVLWDCLDEIDFLRSKLADIHIDAYKAREANIRFTAEFKEALGENADA